jgi:hypothetical protein
MFQYQDKKGNWKNVTNNDVRDYLSQWSLHPKDFRTYHACRICSSKLAELGVADNPKDIIKNINEAIAFTAGFLGHTTAICKRSYVSGEILEAYKRGEIMEDWRESGVDAEFGPPKKFKYSLEQISDLAYKKIRENDGVTIDLQGDTPSEGYAYAPSKGTETKYKQEDFTPVNVESFITKHFEALQEPGNHIGGWVEQGFVYLDISQVGKPNEETIKKASEAQQEAVFDLKNFETIYTEYGKNLKANNKGGEVFG